MIVAFLGSLFSYFFEMYYLPTENFMVLVLENISRYKS